MLDNHKLVSYNKCGYLLQYLDEMDVISVDMNEISSSAVKRRSIIMDKLEEHGKLSAAALSQELGVSTVTIRKDLEKLEKDGLLKRVRGGAEIVKQRTFLNTLYKTTLKIRKEEKQRIAKYAATLVNNGDSVLINVGTTSYYVLQELKNKQNLIILTNSLSIMEDICQNSNMSSIFLGGHVDAYSQSTYGEDAVDQLSKYTADILIMGIDGIDINAGVTSHQHHASDVTRQMVHCAKKRYLVADDRKIGRVSLVSICDLSLFDGIITNETPENKPYLDEMREKGYPIITV